ncbi:hypothetical protein CC86DRAFT_407038 [Ophiobolus disseminans]|uniref:Uncharacterized protein n=1 Tax=Ophiobolus disseminans TaxID=1469910 RepID=A0A6A6ZY43_9PLEO|nr:hypothetical protein CC86DRAFT_407038 [Ophiobolus disseminans]
MTSQSTVSLEWAQSYSKDPSKTGFLDLPRELRDYVYTFAFRVPGAIFIYSANPYSVRPDSKAMIVRYRNEGPIEPQKLGNAIPVPMLRICKQLHAECGPFLYGGNVFRVWFLSDTGLPLQYRQLVRHIMFTTEPDHRIFKTNFDEVNYGWKRRFWPSVITAGMDLIERFPSLETLTCVPITTSCPEWTPAFFTVYNKTKEQRIALAAQWLQSRCPVENDQLRACLRLELQAPPGLSTDEFKGSRFVPDEDEDSWDCTEFAHAFQLMRVLNDVAT